ncbi:hypothetical protein H0H93_007918 [Arthromyces matolae]|nr:hypothetical protein H0H93_007918 [Arthromyces matolae]
MALSDPSPPALNATETSIAPFEVPSIQVGCDTPGANLNNPHSTITTTSTNTFPQKTSALDSGQDNGNAMWGSNFWVTLVDPQSAGTLLSAVSLPPSEEGEWWELSDDSRGGIPYYYQTKTGATVWERPAGFVIPLGIIQNTTLGRRLSQTTRFSVSFEDKLNTAKSPQNRRSRPQSHETDAVPVTARRQTQSPRTISNNGKPIVRTYSTESRNPHTGTNRPVQQLTPIPGSDASAPSTPSVKSRTLPSPSAHETVGPVVTDSKLSTQSLSASTRVKAPTFRPQKPQSLAGAIEKISTSPSDSIRDKFPPQSPIGASSIMSATSNIDEDGTCEDDEVVITRGKSHVPPSPQRPIPATPTTGMEKSASPTVNGKEISSPIPNHAATLQMSPVKNRANGVPILVQPRGQPMSKERPSNDSQTHPVLPAELVLDIKQFSESEFARQYFATHRTGFIFRRKVPVAQMMTWQKVFPLHLSLAKDAVKMFRVIQHLMGDREREKNVGNRAPTEAPSSIQNVGGTTNVSPPGNSIGMLEEERWLLGEGLAHGELRDEIYCQVMKQLTGNPSTESTFRGWQLLCVALVTFPPSKNFETYLSSFLQNHTIQHEGRVDVMAKYCLRRLAYISKKGPRGKPPSLAEIETASDSAFNPSTFGETLDGIIRLQERKYPFQKVPIILPFLADGILALGGFKAEGIFRVPGDADSVSELKLRIDRGYYTTDGVNDPNVLASLMKLWLRELCDPLVPEEMYNECITNSKDAGACVQIVERLPTINRRVVLFVISFLQLFLEERVESLTKMTPANLALVMAPNLLRCNSDSMSVVFTNAQYEQIFVYNLLLHLPCGEIDPDYVPTHGLGGTSMRPRRSKSRARRS